MEGHISALVCIAMGAEPRYYLLAGDAAHHVTLIDPKQPAAIGVYKAKENSLSSKKDTEPDALQSFEDDIGQSYDTMARLARMDAEDNINVCLAHDTSLTQVFRDLSGEHELDGRVIKLRGTAEEFRLFKLRDRADRSRELSTL